MAKKVYLDRDAILAVTDLTTEEVEVPEWGGVVLVRTLTGLERDALEATMIDPRAGRDQEVNLSNLRAKLAAFAIVNEDGERLFSEQDITALAQKSASALQRVFNVAARLSGITESDIEELTKKSESAPNGASGSN